MMDLQTLLFVGIVAVLLAACIVSFMHGKKANTEIMGQKVVLSSLIIGGLLLASVGVLMAYSQSMMAA
jgi:hypothetical protein